MSPHVFCGTVGVYMIKGRVIIYIFSVGTASAIWCLIVKKASP
jgi:hypothetical protein